MLFFVDFSNNILTRNVIITSSENKTNNVTRTLMERQISHMLWQT